MDIIHQIAADLQIIKSDLETDREFEDRVIFSAISKWMLTSVFSNQGKISITALKKICIEKMLLLRDLCSRKDRSEEQPNGSVKIIDYIYQLHLINGSFYHTPLYIIPCERYEVSFMSATLIRGMRQDEMPVFSGIAPIFCQASGDLLLEQEFDIPEMDPRQISDFLWKRSSVVSPSLHINEYLRFHDLKYGYYSPKRQDDNKISLGRNQLPSGGYEYYLINGDEIRRLPEELREECWQEYYRLYAINSVDPQNITVQGSPSLLKVNCGYKLPDKDLKLLRYVSWPNSLENPDGAFSFSMHPSVWPAIKKRLLNLGYKVVLS